MKKLSYGTRKRSGAQSRHVTKHLLCATCEDKFNRDGEAHVLKRIAPKQNTFPLRDEMMKVASLEPDGMARVPAASIDVDADKFAYFALSLVWRGAVTQWRLPDRTLSFRLDLGEYQEPIRKFLNEEADFPKHLIITVTVCIDEMSRQRFFMPTPVTEPNGWKVVSILLRGVFFRIFFGAAVAQQLQDFCCTSASKPIFLGNVEPKTLETFQNMPFPP